MEHIALPYTLFGALLVVELLVAGFFLPETEKTPLPEEMPETASGKDKLLAVSSIENRENGH
jgi:hypothetical protein